MKNIFAFGEKVDAYDVNVLNENEVRASAGILFLFAMISFLNSWLIGDFTMTKTFVVVFLVDFFIRIFINPNFAPSLIIGRFFIRNQKVIYTGAPQKRFAWSIGFGLAVIMFYLIVLNNIIGPFNLLICLICLTLLFFEAAFGICLGCKIYNLFNKEKAKLCPGNSCELYEKEEIQKLSGFKIIIVSLFLIFIYLISQSEFILGSPIQTIKPFITEKKIFPDDCIPPQWAIDMGHRDKWKLHNCKKIQYK